MNMPGPVWVPDVFGGTMLLVALYNAGRLVVARVQSRRIHVDVDVVHVLMGTAMAGMFVTALNPIPAAVWEVVFSAVAGWFAWRCFGYVFRRNVSNYIGAHAHHVSHYPTHVVMAFAMLYMYFAPAAAIAAGGGVMAMSAPAGARADFLELPLLFLFVLVASGVWEVDRAERHRRAVLVASSLVPSAARATTSGPLPASASAPGALAVAGAQLSAEGSPMGAAQPDRVDTSGAWLAPGLMAASHIVMCIAMGYMLVVML